jgi:DNA-directed RNA polymerase subunit M/transcription elongation factor TFIIS
LIVRNECSECGAPFTIDTNTGAVTVRVAANGLRGARHEPARDVNVQAYTSDEVLWCWTCPRCEYSESVYIDDETREALT